MILAHRFSGAVSLSLAVLAGAACGPSVETVDGSAGSGTTGTGAAGTTTSSGTSTTGTSTTGSGGTSTGGTCTGAIDLPMVPCKPELQCAKEGVDCVCGGDGTWYCYSPFTGDKLSTKPPTAPPPEGTCCEEEDLTCAGYATCGPVCRCQGGAWTCEQLDDCPPVACPMDLSTLHGQTCDGHVGAVCANNCTCCLSCSCKLTESGDAVWECTAPPC